MNLGGKTSKAGSIKNIIRNNMVKDKEVLISLVTFKSNWQNQLKEINSNNIERISFFATGLDENEFEKAIGQIEKSCIREIVHVHLRNEHNEEIANYFSNKYNTQYFTLHPVSFNHCLNWSENIRNKVVIEIPHSHVREDDYNFQKILGICIDLSHSKDYHFYGQRNIINKLINQYKVKMNHVGPVLFGCISSHTVTNIRQFNYLKHINRNLLSDTLCLEVTNSIDEQLKFKKIIEEIINDKKSSN
jgi:hypothetical protein